MMELRKQGEDLFIVNCYIIASLSLDNSRSGFKEANKM